ncbi:hypothetical protein [Enterovibrio coralii]|uniref:Uncharacterized protein n=1 Tax=Enterovibrio coralii TaxID=294935 RepID=A0A135I4F4_9GAMM|nr:hypothetical protein [Enterovibrio coralii]KXF80330.1 hypothetical protein ATN88_10950 [Enterovibrio coralii]
MIAARTIELKQHQLRFDLDAIQRIFDAEFVDRKSISALVSIGDESFEHPIYEMIRLVLLTAPDSKPRQIWNAIKTDFISGGRVLDTAGLVSSMDSDSLDWLSSGVRDSMTFDSFRVATSKIRSGKIKGKKV